MVFIGQFAAWTYITPFLIDHTQLSSGVITLLYLIYGFGGIVGGGRFADRPGNCAGTLRWLAGLLIILGACFGESEPLNPEACLDPRRRSENPGSRVGCECYKPSGSRGLRIWSRGDSWYVDILADSVPCRGVIILASFHARGVGEAVLHPRPKALKSPERGRCGRAFIPEGTFT